MNRAHARLSVSESRLYEMIPEKKKNRVTTEWLADRYYGKKNRSFYARHAILVMLSAMRKKLAGADRRLVTTGRIGPRPMEVWLEKAK